MSLRRHTIPFITLSIILSSCGVADANSTEPFAFQSDTDCDLAYTFQSCGPIELLFSENISQELKAWETLTFGERIISRYNDLNVAVFEINGTLIDQVSLVENNVITVDLEDVNGEVQKGYVVNYQGKIFVLYPPNATFDFNKDAPPIKFEVDI